MTMTLENIKNAMQTKKFARDVKRYIHLIENLFTVDVTTDIVFQRTYNGFFQLRRNEFYRKKHYEFLEKNKTRKDIGFSEILAYLSTIQNSIEASFASKMLSIINVDAPVLDRKVLAKLNFKLPKLSSKDRVGDTIVLYNKIENWYNDFYTTSKFKDWINLFDGFYPNTDISAAKKVDFVLWQLD